MSKCTHHWMDCEHQRCRTNGRCYNAPSEVVAYALGEPPVVDAVASCSAILESVPAVTTGLAVDDAQGRSGPARAVINTSLQSSPMALEDDGPAIDPTQRLTRPDSPNNSGQTAAPNAAK